MTTVAARRSGAGDWTAEEAGDGPPADRSGGGDVDVRERAVRFGPDSGLVGIVTEPPDGGSRRRGVLLVNAGILHRVGPSRLNVIMARSLARAGFVCLRFDLSGIGDSDPRSDSLSFEESSVRDVREAMDLLQATHDLRGFLVVGLCSGADLAYRTAVADARIEAIAPIDGHSYRTKRYQVHRYLPRLLNARSWLNVLTGRTYVGPWIRRLLGRSAAGASGDAADGGGIFQRPLPPKERMAEDLRVLVGRRVRLLVIFSGGMQGRYNYGSQFRDAFRSIEFQGLVDEVYFPGADHTFTDRRRLDALVSTVTRWAREHPPT